MQMNEQAIQRKIAAKEAVKKEMEDILIYQAMKDAELLKREQEEEAIENAKRERQKQLLASQEKAMNRAGEQDELRARRAAEEVRARQCKNVCTYMYHNLFHLYQGRATRSKERERRIHEAQK